MLDNGALKITLLKLIFRLLILPFAIFGFIFDVILSLLFYLYYNISFVVYY